MNEVRDQNRFRLHVSCSAPLMQPGAAIPPPPQRQPVAITFEKFKAIQRQGAGVHVIRVSS
jgi:hypothetical protein